MRLLSLLFVVLFSAGSRAHLRADILTERSILVPLGTSPLAGSALVDLDGDGDDDWVSISGPNVTPANEGAIVELHENVGGTLQLPRSLATLPVVPDHLVFGDLDADGDLDIVAALPGTTNFELGWLEYSQLDGSLAAWKPIEAGGERGRLVFEDFDCDGDLDLVAGSRTNGAVDWFENQDGLGGFGPGQTIAVLGSPIGALDTIDADADGDPDLLVSSTGEGGSSAQTLLVTNEGGILSASSTTVVVPERGTFAVGDVDGDGWSDLVLDAASVLQWFRTEPGSTPFSNPVVLDQRRPALSIVHVPPRILKLMDLDDDGDLDLLFDVSPGTYSGTTLALMFEGLEFGAELIARRHEGHVTFLGAGDIDGDRALDVVLRTEDDGFARSLEYEPCQGSAPGLQLPFGDATANGITLLPDPRGGPLADSLWRPRIDHGNLTTFVFLDRLYVSAERLEQPFQYFGALHLNPDPAAGFALIGNVNGPTSPREFVTTVPGTCALIGETWYVQALTLGTFVAEFSTALEVTIGSY